MGERGESRRREERGERGSGGGRTRNRERERVATS